MRVRILTAVVSIPVFLGLLYVGKWPLFALVAGMGLIGFYEYARMWRTKEVHVSLAIGEISLLALYAWAFLAPGSAAILGCILAAAIIATNIWMLVRFGERSVPDAVATLAGIFYLGLFSYLLLLRGLGAGTGWDDGLRWVTQALVCTWVGDSCAYFFGIKFGKRKLAEAISPHKSVEGAIGGGACTVVAGWFWAPMVGIAPWQGALVAAGGFLLSVMGDLTESALKRHTGVKDSGKLLPGHGGLLDRFDSSLFVWPFVYYVAVFLFHNGW